ncbi:TonB family protein [Brevundimonas sp.]|uniref:TonB family protein n=1 Tax=Brevundimonas sp. TaxID=1871086 RepID=UPI0026286B19|nr:TonB family protein [Brevundimonas sp.]
MLLLLLALTMPQAVPAAPADPAVTAAALPLVEIPGPIERRAREAEALGHTGDVTLEVVVQPDGSKGPATVVESSRSDLLDAEATRLVSGAGFGAPAEATRYRVTVGFQGADDALTCAAMARQVRWFQQTWPERPLKDMPLYKMSSGILLMAGVPATPNRASAQAAVNQMQRLEADFPALADQCEREPERAWYPFLGEWARRTSR